MNALEDPAYRAQVKSSAKKAVEFRSKFAGRTPLHIAAIRGGHDSDLYQALLELEIAANGDDSRIARMVDDYGKTPLDYNGPEDTINVASLKGYGRGRAFVPTPSQEANFNGFSYEEEDSGGWGVTYDTALEESPLAGVRIHGRSRCDIHEVTLPSSISRCRFPLSDIAFPGVFVAACDTSEAGPSAPKRSFLPL